MTTLNSGATCAMQRTVWYDVVRLVAFLLLLGCHATDPFNAAATYGNATTAVTADELQWSTIWGTLVRPCVPLFVMLTGALLLPVKTDMRTFYQRRIPRVFFPFIIWSILYYLTPWVTGLLGCDSSMVYKIFSWAESDSQQLSDALTNVAKIPLTFSYIACHMWYIYLIIGLYLYLPIFSAWVAQASKRQKEWVLALWAFSTTLPYIHEFCSTYAFGTCSWNSFDTFYYFAGFNGYLLMGHYISHHVDWSFSKRVVLSFVLMMAGAVATHYGYCHMLNLPSPTPEQVELFWTYCTPNVVAMSIAWMLLLKNAKVQSPKLRTTLQHLTTCGFGIYMIHYFFVGPAYEIVAAMHLPTCLRIPMAAVIMLAISWMLVGGLRKILGNHSRWIVG